MRAVVCEKYGGPQSLAIKEVKNPSSKPNEVLIDIRSAAVNFPDTLIIQGKYQIKPAVPFIPGSDLAGVVSAVGDQVKNIKPGDEVIGFTRTGAFAEKIVLPADACFPKPNKMDFNTAASFTMAYGTSYHALKDRATLKKDETLLVLGASGGVGLAAVELGKCLGAHVIAAASTDEKLQLCRDHGADELVNYHKDDLKSKIKHLTSGKGVDVVYDAVGGKYSEPALRATAWNGRYLVIGFATGDIPKIPLNLPLLKGCAIVGVFWGSFTARDPQSNNMNVKELTEMYEQGKIKPHIDQTYSLEKTPIALEDMMNRKLKGKVVIKIN